MMQSGFIVLQSNRLENLRRVTVEWVRRNPLPALESEVILVQSNGFAHWLKLALAQDSNAPVDAGCGIAAALDIDLPGRFHWNAYRSVLGELPQTSPYDKPLLVWRLLRLLPELLDDPQFAALQHFLSNDQSQRKLFQLAQRLADLLDQYQIYREDWLNDWSAGHDQISRDGQLAELPAAQRWQAELWRRLQQDIPAAERWSGRAQIHAKFLAACRDWPEGRPAGLPQRVIVFGLSSLPPQTLELLAAVARFCQIILCVHNPCQHYWGDIVDPQTPVFDRGNSLLAAWGRQGRDYIRLLETHHERSAHEALFADNTLALDLFEAPTESTRLGRLQADIFHLRSRAELTALPPLPAADQSISFHIAHGRQREVEILQDNLLDLLAATPGLQPRDILVMVPDINQFAPHIQAVFGRLSREDDRYIPFTVSDQGNRRRASVYQALDMLLNLHQSRFTVSELLDLLDVPAVQRAFGLRETDHALLHRWVSGAGIRWGLSAAQRLEQNLLVTDNPQTAAQNTWQFGLQRMLLGYATGNAGAWQDIEPYDEVGGLDAALAGIISRVLQRLDWYRQLWKIPATVTDWSERISALLGEFFATDDDSELLLLNRAEQKLLSWREHCALADFEEPLGIAVVSEFFLESLDQTDLNQRFLAGAVNFATLMPMRAIPFRHICLLGMNDGDYPRQVPAVDFDMMRHDYRPGDRSRREDDRYLFLEALLSARDSLYISWTGRSIHDNSERPPSVLVAQLQDYLQDSVDIEVLTTVYPLQPFSAAYFTAGSARHTYAREWQPALRIDALAAAPEQPTTSAQSSPTEPVTLRHLSALLKDPAAVYFEHVLGIVFRDVNTDVEDNELFSIDGLQKWQIQDELIRLVLNQLQSDPGPEPDMALHLRSGLDKIQRQGALPMSGFADLYRTELIKPLIEPLLLYQQLTVDYPSVVQVPVFLADPVTGCILEDNMSDLRVAKDGSVIRIAVISGQIWSGHSSGKKSAQIKWHYLTRLWPAHLAAQLHGPVVTHIIGPATREMLPALTAAQATTHLLQLLSLWQRNLQSPLPAVVKTSCHWLAQDADSEPSNKTRQLYEGANQINGEVQNSNALARLWPDFDELWTAGFAPAASELYGPLQAFWHQHRQQAGE
jgi:exodeoxyribonuclease V gamma subunit